MRCPKCSVDINIRAQCKFPSHISALAEAVLQNDIVAVYALFDALNERPTELMEDGGLDFNKFISECSVRVRKMVNKLQIQSFKHLLTFSQERLLKCKNFGNSSLCELINKLDKMGMRLRISDETTH